MQNRTDSANFNRNTPVVYYSDRNDPPLSCFMGGKMGGYRVLTTSKDSDSGWCIPIKEMSRRVFPAPNVHGVFEDHLCQTFGARLDRQCYLIVQYVQAGPNVWGASVSWCFGTSGFGSLPSKFDDFPSFEIAIKTVLTDKIQDLARLASGAPTHFDQGVSKSRLPAVRKFAAKAIYELLTALPRPLSSDILISLSKKSGRKDE